MNAVLNLYGQIIDRELMLRRISLTFNDVEVAVDRKITCCQISIFAEYILEKEQEDQNNGYSVGAASNKAEIRIMLFLRT